MEKKARAGWVDAARGIGILLIVLIHSIRPDMREANAACRLVYELIISFVNGMFFVLAGVTYRMAGGRREEAPGRFLMKKARALLLPFFGYALLVYAAFSFAAWFPPTARVFQGTEYGRMPLGEYLRLTLREDSPYAAHLWFIWVLFWITAAVYAADSLCKRWGLPRQRVLWAIALAGCVAGTLVGGGNSAAVRVLTHTVYFVYGTEFAVRPALPERASMGSALAAVLSAGVMVRVVL